MVLFTYATKELTARVVYYGAGLCGKTTNLQWIHEKLPIRNKGKMLSLATETDRTLFFDFLPIEIGTIRGMRTRIQLYTVPGQVFYNATRRMVLKGADCVIFVCDSQEAMIDPNVESFENMRENLKANEIDADEIPVVLQYNKRDLPNALPIEILNERLNPRNYPFFEAVAVKGIGVEDTLKGATKLVFKSLATRYGEQPGTNPGLRAPSSNPPAPAAKAAAPARAPAPPRAGAPAPAPPTRSTATIPPVAAGFGTESDDLLESLDGPSLDPVGEGGGGDEFERPAPACRTRPPPPPPPPGRGKGRRGSPPGARPPSQNPRPPAESSRSTSWAARGRGRPLEGAPERGPVRRPWRRVPEDSMRAPGGRGSFPAARRNASPAT